MSDETHNPAEDEPRATDAAATGEAAPNAPAPDSHHGNGRPADAPVPTPSDEAGLENDDAEVMPIVQKPLSRPLTAGAPEKKKKDEGPVEMNWYILKVQSNRERSIADALKRKVAIEGLDKYFGEIVVPTEKVTEFKGGKKKVVERKLYPGYIVVNMHISDLTWFAVRETSGIGDFTGAGGKPSPMLPHEIAKILHKEEEESAETPKLDIRFKVGDKVKVKDGTFEGFEGEVGSIDPQSGKVSVMISIFGRSTPVELEYWQVEGV